MAAYENYQYWAAQDAAFYAQMMQLPGGERFVPFWYSPPDPYASWGVLDQRLAADAAYSSTVNRIASETGVSADVVQAGLSQNQFEQLTTGDIDQIIRIVNFEIAWLDDAASQGYNTSGVNWSYSTNSDGSISITASGLTYSAGSGTGPSPEEVNFDPEVDVTELLPLRTGPQGLPWQERTREIIGSSRPRKTVRGIVTWTGPTLLANASMNTRVMTESQLRVSASAESIRALVSDSSTGTTFWTSIVYVIGDNASVDYGLASTQSIIAVAHSHSTALMSQNAHFGPGDHDALLRAKHLTYSTSYGVWMVMEARDGLIWETTISGRNAGNSVPWVRTPDQSGP